MMKTQKTKEQMIKDILQVCKINNVPTTGDLFLALAFRSEAELSKICSELYIKQTNGL